MTSFERFENRLPVLLDELAVPRLPDYADDLFARTAATRQRPGWTFPERWLFMSSIAQRLAAAPNIPWRLGALVALLAVAALVAALVAGSLTNDRPAPYGPAENGKIVFINPSGRVVIGDPATAQTSVLVDDAGSRNPIFSQDGRKVAFLRLAENDRLDVVVVGVDGSNMTTITAEPILEPSYLGWSPRGDRLLVSDAAGRLLLYDATRPTSPTDFSERLGLHDVSTGLGYNFRSTAAFRPPDGDEIAFVAGAPGQRALMAVRHDGAGARTIVDLATSGVEYQDLLGAEWSPDGSQLVVLLVQSVDAAHPQVSHSYVVDADGTNLRPLGNLLDHPLIGENSPLWSPDGTRVAFQYWTAHADNEGQDFHPIGVVDVATGELRDVGPLISNGYISWEWSPDGKSILEVPQDDSGKILIVDVETRLSRTAPWQVDQPINWQRVAP